jgi:hypothetical protein
MATDNVNTPSIDNNREAWNAVVADFEQKKATRDSVGEKMTDAEEAYIEEVSGRDFWAEYGLPGLLKTRADVLKELRYLPATIAGRAAARGEPLTDEFISGLYRDLPRIADEYMAHSQLCEEARKRYGLKENEAAYDVAATAFWEAQKKLLDTPAPDVSAILYKLDVVAAVMTEDCEQDAPAVSLIRDDMRRLFGTVSVPETL